MRLGIAGAAVIISNKTTGRVDWVCFSSLTGDFESDYVDHYARLDRYMPLLNIDVGWQKLSEILPDAILRKSEWYNDFVLSCGVRDILGARLVETQSHFVTFGLHQRLGRRFGDDAAETMEMIAGPLSSATLRHIRRLFSPKHQTSKTDPGGATYYFHVTSGKQYPDEIGRTFPSDHDAVAHASVLAAELAQDEDWDSFVISVTDANGRVIAHVPVARVPVRK
jgi:hypothetical protein